MSTNSPACSCTTRDVGLLIIRVGLGITFMIHGWPKLVGGPAYWTQLGGAAGLVGIHAAPTFFGFMAAIAEVGGGLCLLLGLLLRPVALALVFNMIVAIQFHRLGPVPDIMRTFAAGWSHPLEDGIVFLGLVFTGAGAISLDALLFRRRGSEVSMGAPA